MRLIVPKELNNCYCPTNFSINLTHLKAKELDGLDKSKYYNQYLTCHYLTMCSNIPILWELEMHAPSYNIYNDLEFTYWEYLTSNNGELFNTYENLLMFGIKCQLIV